MFSGVTPLGKSPQNFLGKGKFHLYLYWDIKLWHGNN